MYSTLVELKTVGSPGSRKSARKVTGVESENGLLEMAILKGVYYLVKQKLRICFQEMGAGGRVERKIPVGRKVREQRH